jgi:bifunctional DNA-binding transcriptional regulator/antitoxin component of YhaV-PrlF toxin-antitoxin module
MLAKLTSKNQITIPKKIMSQIADTKYFDVAFKDGIISLTPLKVYETDLEKIRAKMKKLGLGPESVAEAVEWVRSK